MDARGSQASVDDVPSLTRISLLRERCSLSTHSPCQQTDIPSHHLTDAYIESRVAPKVDSSTCYPTHCLFIVPDNLQLG